MWKKRFKAYSLLEIAIVLAIIGVIMLSIMKGQELVHQARIIKAATQIDVIMSKVTTFQNTYASLPGDSNSPDLPAETPKGDGNGIISGEETNLFFRHLISANLLNENQTKPIIGAFIIKYKDGTHYLVLAANNDESPLFTKAEAQKLVKNLQSNAQIVDTAKQRGANSSKDEKAFVIYVEFP